MNKPRDLIGEVVHAAWADGSRTSPSSRGPTGRVALRLNPWTAARIDRVEAGPMVAVGLYDDAQRLVGATGVGP